MAMAAGDIQKTGKCPLKETFNFDALEKLGCTKRFAERRTQMYKIASACGTELIRQLEREDTYPIGVGSRGEGINISCASDADILFVQRRVICLENLQRPTTMDLNTYIVTFQLDFENLPPGYARLRLVSFNNTSITNWPRNNMEFLKNLKYALFRRNGDEYLRNDQPLTTVFRNYRTGCIRQQSVFADKTGPARALLIQVPMMPEIAVPVDCVLAFKCKYPSVLVEWSARKRKYSWPNKKLIEKVNGLDVFVVPAGYKVTTDEELQWRISLTLAEQALVHSFNDIQIKLYTALKILAKHELQTICDNITSYIVKNCIFWSFENNDINEFTKDRFDCSLLKILQFLKSCIHWKYLPNYMNTSMNMLHTKITEKHKTELVQRIDFLIISFDCGHMLLLKCPLVQEISLLSADELEQKIVFKELVEQIFMSVICITATHHELKYLMWECNTRKAVQVYRVLSEHVFPRIRKYNPLGFFDHLKSISNQEVFSRLLTGVERGYHKSM